MTEFEIAFEKLKQEYIDYRTTEHIVVCATEEMSEVTKELMKYLRHSHKFSIAHLSEEVAHATLLIEMIERVFKLNKDVICTHQVIALEKGLKDEDHNAIVKE